VLFELPLFDPEEPLDDPGVAVAVLVDVVAVSVVVGEFALF
jgi:hypothetical protein